MFVSSDVVVILLLLVFPNFVTVRFFFLLYSFSLYLPADAPRFSYILPFCRCLHVVGSDGACGSHHSGGERRGYIVVV